ncbi:MAG: N-acetylmuramoyl-L-alanine amidase [Sporomusaceae bacterium]|nr:N-acetylmuramoyl-L-alanine amidase [Sporomusaceae bacterium]
MSHDFFRRFLLVALVLGLAISGTLCDKVWAANAEPKADIEAKIAANAAKTVETPKSKVPVVAPRKEPVKEAAKKDIKEAVKPPAKTASATSATANKKGITDVRWSTTTDALTGEETFRVVFETSSSVKVKDSLDADKLTIILKGIKPGDLKNIDFGSNIVSKAVFSLEGKKDTRIVFSLADAAKKENYEVFTLKKNIEPGKPFRVVLNIVKPVQLPNFAFTPGLKNKVVAIDPGHGGSDSGAIGTGGTKEKNVNLTVAKLVKDLLEKEDVTVILTRSVDRDVSFPDSSAAEELGARVNVANRQKADVFVSIHHDAFTNSTVGGTSTYYYKKTVYDGMLAKTLQNRMVQAGGLQNRQVHSSNFYVVKNTRMPAALVELAFISNPNEERLLNSSAFQRKMAQAIVDGIKDFFDQAAKLSGGGGKN